MARLPQVVFGEVSRLSAGLDVSYLGKSWTTVGRQAEEEVRTELT